LPEIYRVQNGGPPAAQPLAALLDALRTAAEEDDDARVRALLRELCRPRKPRREAPRRLAQAEFLPPGQL
ncbi:MAG: hypothetical protein ACE5HB_10395, partial [Terriglobia bacterium]